MKWLSATEQSLSRLYPSPHSLFGPQTPYIIQTGHCQNLHSQIHIGDTLSDTSTSLWTVGNFFLSVLIGSRLEIEMKQQHHSVSKQPCYCGSCSILGIRGDELHSSVDRSISPETIPQHERHKLNAPIQSYPQETIHSLLLSKLVPGSTETQPVHPNTGSKYLSHTKHVHWNKAKIKFLLLILQLKGHTTSWIYTVALQCCMNLGYLKDTGLP